MLGIDVCLVRFRRVPACALSSARCQMLIVNACVLSVVCFFGVSFDLSIGAMAFRAIRPMAINTHRRVFETLISSRSAFFVQALLAAAKMAGDISRLALVNAHERDSRIKFREEGHQYWIDGVSGEYVSTTTLIHHSFAPFNSDEVIAKMMKGRNWATSPYNGMSVEEIKAAWEANRDEAARLGTEMHYFIEVFNNRPDWNDEARLHEMLDLGRRELLLFSHFMREVVYPRGWIPYRCEWTVFHETYKICGSIDMLYRDGDGEYIMVDWKRSKEVKTSNWFQKGLGVVSHLDDCNFNHYSLQLSIYKRILAERYGVNVRQLFLVILHPKQDEYIMLEVTPLDVEVEEIFQHRKRLLAGEASDGASSHAHATDNATGDGTSSAAVQPKEGFDPGHAFIGSMMDLVSGAGKE